MTPTQAAQVLREVDGYEETVHLHTQGLTNMVWGLAVAAIFLAYGTAIPWLETVDAMWLAPFLWIPFAAGALVTGNAIWATQAARLGITPSRRDLVISGGLVLGFLAASAVLWSLLDDLAPLDWQPPAALLLATGLFSIVLGLLYRTRSPLGCNASIIAGVSTATAAVALAATGWALDAQTLVAALGGGATWFVPGLILYRRG